MVETVKLIEAGARGRALWNVLGSWSAGTVAAMLGLLIPAIASSGPG